MNKNNNSNDNNNNSNNDNNSSNKNSTTNKDFTLIPISQNSKETVFILGDSIVKKLNGFLLTFIDKKTQS